MSDATPLLDMEGAAEYLSDTPRHLRRLAQERQLPFIKVGGKVRFRRQDLDTYVESRRTPAVS